MKTLARLCLFLVLLVSTAIAADSNLEVTIPGTRRIYGCIHDYQSVGDMYSFHDALWIERGSGMTIVCRLRKPTEQELAYAKKTWHEDGCGLGQVVIIPDLGKLYLFTYSMAITDSNLLYRSGIVYLVTDIGYKPGTFEQKQIGFDDKKLPEENRRLLDRLKKDHETISAPPTMK